MTSLGPDLEKIDQLLAVLAASPAPQSRLVEEHAQFARAYLLGAMPEECEATLAMARDAAGDVPDAATRDGALSLIDAVISARQPR